MTDNKMNSLNNSYLNMTIEDIRQKWTNSVEGLVYECMWNKYQSIHPKENKT